MIYDIQLSESRPMSEEDDDAPKYNSTYSSQLGWLLWRQIKMDLKNPLATKIVALQIIVVLIIFIEKFCSTIFKIDCCCFSWTYLFEVRK